MRRGNPASVPLLKFGRDGEMAEIQVAYAVSKHGYRAKAYVLDAGIKHSFATGLGDSANEAMGEAVRYVEQMFERDGLVAPTAIHFNGRLSGIIVDAFAF